MIARREAVRSQLAVKSFTVLELLMAVGIIALLISIMLPAMQASRRAARNVKCMSQMRLASYEFRLFADDFAAQNRGDSEVFGESRFEVEDFQDSLYRVDEYWDRPETRSPVAYQPSEEVMMCPEGPRFLQRYPIQGQSHEPGFVLPHANVSIAVNMRLHRRVMVIDGTAYLVPAVVTGKILDHPNVPVLLDVDGEKAAALKRVPYYIAPPLGGDDPYGTGNYWFPSFRHKGGLNAAFVGGHVLTSSRPLSEPAWNWSYQPAD